MTKEEIWLQLPEAVKAHKDFDESIEIGSYDIRFSFRYISDYEGRVVSDCFVYLKEIGSYKFKKVWTRKSQNPKGDIPQSQIKTLLESVEKYLAEH